MVLMEKATTRAFWEQVRLGEEYRELRALVAEDYAKSRMESIPVLDFALRMRFYADGDRTAFEDAYFRRRHFLGSAALLALIYPDETVYLRETQQIIWAICEEYTWAIPAHCAGDATDSTVIDLFAAETAFTLAEIQYLLQDRLHPEILERIKAEVDKRIVYNYDNGNFWWKKTPYNWAAVCSGNIGGALVYLFPEKLEERLPQLMETLRGFIAGFPADGTCLEGVTYWDYGFGNFACFAELLYQHTDGEINLFAWDNVDNIAAYPQRNFLKGNTAVSFSDSTPNVKADRGLQVLLRKKFPDKLSAIDPVNCIYNTGRIMWRPAFRNFYYLDSSSPASGKQRKDYYLPDAGQVILNRENYSLAAKAGHNNEPHNHNDVGTFILATAKGQVICDLGAGLYTRDYFIPKTRYNYFCTRSAGHSVPMIDGNQQKPGNTHKGNLAYSDGVIRINYREAYDIPSLEKLERIISCRESSVTLTDCFQIPYESFTERFITLFPPEAAQGEIKVADVRLQYDPDVCTVRISETAFQDHSKEAKTVYCIDFQLQKGLCDVTFTFAVDTPLENEVI